MFARWELMLPSLLFRVASGPRVGHVRLNAREPRAVYGPIENPAGLRRFRVRIRSFTIERIYAYKTYTQKCHNHFILNTSLYPHGVLRINKKHYEYARKKTRHQRLSLCVNHNNSIRCRYNIIIQNSKNSILL